MDSLEEYVINHSACGMPRCEYVENDIEIDCDECQKRMIAEHDAQIRADERANIKDEFKIYNRLEAKFTLNQCNEKDGVYHLDVTELFNGLVDQIINNEEQK